MANDSKEIIFVVDMLKEESMRVKETQEDHLSVLSKGDGKSLELLAGERDVLMQGSSQNIHKMLWIKIFKPHNGNFTSLCNIGYVT